jgi:hypothetical protein
MLQDSRAGEWRLYQREKLFTADGAAIAEKQSFISLRTRRSLR